MSAMPVFLLSAAVIFVLVRVATSKQNNCATALRRVVVAGVLVGIVVFVYVNRLPEHLPSSAAGLSLRPPPVNRVYGFLSAVTADDDQSSLQSNGPANETGTVTPVEDRDNSDNDGDADKPGGHLAESEAEDSDSDKAIVLFVSGEELQKLLGEEGVKTLTGLEGLQRVYAMVPLSATGPQGLPPVLREALSPAVLRQMLSPAGMKILTIALSRILASDESDSAAAVPAGVLSAEAIEVPQVSTTVRPPHIPATWIDNPGVGRIVVKSDFLEAIVAPEDALRSAIESALSNRVSRMATAQFGADSEWQKLVRVSLTDQAIRGSIVAQDVRTEVIETAAGSHPMKQTYALVEFSESMEQQVLSQIKVALRRNRLIALSLTVGVLWLASIFFTLACRGSQHGSLFRKLAAFPVMALLILPCLLVFAFMVDAMIKGTTFEFRPEAVRITCTIDHS